MTEQAIDEQINAGAGAAEAGASEPERIATVFGEDWREKLAAKEDNSVDDDLMKSLSRFSTPKDVAKALVEARKKIGEGIKKPLSKNASPEEVSAWRKDMGVPEAPDGYDLNIDGVKINDYDKPLINTFLERMHAKHATPELVKEAVKAYYDVQETQLAAMAEADIEGSKAREDALRLEYGAEYRSTMQHVTNFLSTAPESVQNAIKEARMPDGTKLENTPELFKWLDNLRREIDPTSAILPNGMSKPSDVDSRISEIQGKMKSGEYFRDGGKMRAEYVKLLEMKQKLAGGR